MCKRDPGRPLLTIIFPRRPRMTLSTTLIYGPLTLDIAYDFFPATPCRVARSFLMDEVFLPTS